MILVDDAHEVRPALAQELLSAAQLLRTKGSPLLFVLAGTAQIFSALDRGKGAVWKRSAHLEIGPLDREHSKLALMVPLKPIEDDRDGHALDLLLDEAKGQPFRLQEIGALMTEELQAPKKRGERREVTVPLAQSVLQHLKQLDTERASTDRKSTDREVSKIRRHKGRTENLKAKNRELGCRVSAREAEKHELSRQYSEAEERITYLELQRGKLEVDVARQSVEAQELARKNDEFATKNGRLLERVDQMTIRENDLSALSGRQAEQIAAPRSSENQLEGRVAQQEVQIRDLSAQIEKFSSKSGRLQLEIERLENDKDQISEQGRKEAEEVVSLTSAKAYLEGRYEQLDLENRDLKVQREELQSLADFYRQKKEQRPTMAVALW